MLETIQNTSEYNQEQVHYYFIYDQCLGPPVNREHMGDLHILFFNAAMI